MFWRGRKTHARGEAKLAAGDAEEGARAQAQSPPERNAEEAAVDALAAILRALGDFAFDLADIDAQTVRERFEGWARHAVVGAPRPELDPPDAPSGSRRRDWVSLRHFACDHRRREHDYVTTSLRDLRQVIWLFIQGLARAVVQDRGHESELHQQLARLRSAIDAPDTSRLRKEALASVSLMERVIEERKEREQRQLETLAEEIRRVSGELTEARERMAVDPLTQVYNRAALDEQLERVANLGQLFGRPAFLYLIDIDHFKWVNDRFGHAAGDEVLVQLGRCLRRTFRRRGDFVARFGGDEFVALVEEDSLEAANRLGEKLLFAVRSLEVPHEKETIRISVSVGAAQLAPGEEVAQWLERADRALYGAKNLGRDRVVIDLETPD